MLFFSWRVHGAGIYLKPKQAAGEKDPLFRAKGSAGDELNAIKEIEVIGRSS